MSRFALIKTPAHLPTHLSSLIMGTDATSQLKTSTMSIPYLHIMYPFSVLYTFYVPF